MSSPRSAISGKQPSSPDEPQAYHEPNVIAKIRTEKRKQISKDMQNPACKVWQAVFVSAHASEQLCVRNQGWALMCSSSVSSPDDCCTKVYIHSDSKNAMYKMSTDLLMYCRRVQREQTQTDTRLTTEIASVESESLKCMISAVIFVGDVALLGTSAPI